MLSCIFCIYLLQQGVGGAGSDRAGAGGRAGGRWAWCWMQTRRRARAMARTGGRAMAGGRTMARMAVGPYLCSFAGVVGRCMVEDILSFVHICISVGLVHGRTGLVQVVACRASRPVNGGLSEPAVHFCASSQSAVHVDDLSRAK